MGERKGILTPEQEQILDDVLKFNNKAAEAVDGLAISLIDNQALELAKQELLTKYPGAESIMYQIVDILFAGIAEIAKEG